MNILFCTLIIMIILTALSMKTLNKYLRRHVQFFVCHKGGTKAPANFISKTGPIKLLFLTLIGVIVLNTLTKP